MKKIKIKECHICAENINIDTEKFLKTHGWYLCDGCIELFCYKCKQIKHKCFKCHIIQCTNCENGCYYSDNWTDIDIYYCHECRLITCDELYKYFKDKYNEELTIDQIRKIILE